MHKIKIKYIIFIFFIIFIAIASIIIYTNKYRNVSSNLTKSDDLKYPYEITMLKNKNANHISELTEYTSPYTVAYENKDKTKTIYIFGAPIRFSDNQNNNKLIDNTIIPVENNINYSYKNKINNIEILFPKSINNNYGIVIKNKNNNFSLEIWPKEYVENVTASVKKVYNMYGDLLDAVVYNGIFGQGTQLNCYITNTGIITEVVFSKKPISNEFDFIIKSSESIEPDANNKYVEFKNNNSAIDPIKAIVQSFITKDSYLKLYKENEGHISYNNQINVERYNNKNNSYIVKMEIDKNLINDKNTIYPIKFDPSFAIYVNKFPDSTVYSATPTSNVYLQNINIIGNSNLSGTSETLVRFNENIIKKLDPNKIISAYYYVKELSGFNSNAKFSIWDVDEDWCSLTVTWNTKPKYSKLVNEINLNKSEYYSFDLTRLVKKWANIKDANFNKTHICNFMIRENDNNSYWRIFASNDNLLYVPFLEINIK
jgi:hypothetical protein